MQTSQLPSASQAAGRRTWALGMLVSVLTAAAVLSANAWAAGKPAVNAASAPAAASQGDTSPPDGRSARMHPMGHMGHMGMPFEGRHLDRMLDTVKATDAQRTQIRAIAEKARADLQALHQRVPQGADGQPQHPYHAMMALLAQPEVDAAGAERLRQQWQAQHDAVSKRMLQAAVEVARVLTPEQRATLAREMQARAERRDGDRMPRHPHGPGREGEGRPAVR